MTGILGWTLLLLAPVAESGVASEDAVRLARQTLAAHLGVPEARLRTDDVEPASWPDASLGCPEKGMRYTPALTSGHRVKLRMDDRTYEVRVADGRAVPCGVLSAERTSFLAAGARLYDRARRELAEKLGVTPKEIEVTVLKPTTWPDTSLGCPEPGQRYEAVPTLGYVIELRHAEKGYRYHSDTTRVVPCDRPKR